MAESEASLLDNQDELKTLSYHSQRKPLLCLPLKQGNWRSTIRISITGTSLVLLCNTLLLTISLLKLPKDEYISGSRTLYTGSCALSARYNTFAHFLINIASTVILGSSGYCMVSDLASSRTSLTSFSNVFQRRQEMKSIARTLKINS
jgi:hypothetical protein